MTSAIKWIMPLFIIALLAAGGCASVQGSAPSSDMPKYHRAGLFRALDKDGDRRISRKEYYSIYQDQDAAKKFFDLYDGNGDEYLDPDEFHAPGITVFSW